MNEIKKSHNSLPIGHKQNKAASVRGNGIMKMSVLVIRTTM
jgi:hypothetical protein